MNKFLLILLSIFLISSVSALSCDRSTLDNLQRTMTCTDASSVSVSAVGQFSVTPNLPLNFNNGSIFLTITIASNAPTGSLGVIILNNSNQTVTIPVSNNQDNSCQLNPSLISYTQAVQQGTNMPLPKITFNPQNCNGQLSLSTSSVSIQGGILTTEGQKPVSIASIQSDGVNLNLNTAGLNSQTYSSYLNIIAFGKQFQIPFIITVTTGTNPNTNFDSANLPTCSLSSTTLNLNSTAQLICTNMQPDVTVTPDIDNSFVIGTGVDKTSNQYIWKFSPIKMGNTVIKAKFSYQDSPVGSPYQQEIRIISSGSGVGGTDLKFIFTPALNKALPNLPVIVQVIDNKTGTLISNAEVLVDALPLSMNGSVYFFSFNAMQNYSFRAKASGYDDLVETIYLLNLPLEINITPPSGDSATVFRIIPSANATLFIDGTKVEIPFISTLTAGNHTIKALKEGYLDAEKLLIVDYSASLTSSSEWKKGVKQIFIITKNVSWSVNFAKDINTQKSNLVSGEGTLIEFTPEKKGIYYIESNGRTLGTYELTGWDGLIFGIAWYYIVGALILIYIIYSISKKNKSYQSTLFAGNTNTG